MRKVWTPRRALAIGEIRAEEVNLRRDGKALVIALAYRGAESEASRAK
jgi:hypothetical protein